MLERLIGEHIRLVTELGSSLGALRERPRPDRPADHEPGRQRARCHARRAVKCASTTSAREHRRPRSWVRLAIARHRHGHDRAPSRSGCSSRSSRPRQSAKAPGSGWRPSPVSCATAAGDITVESVLGQGSTFVILLPAARNGSERRRSPTRCRSWAAPNRCCWSRTKTPIRVLAQQVLQRAGYAVVAAVNAAEAIEAARPARLRSGGDRRAAAGRRRARAVPTAVRNRNPVFASSMLPGMLLRPRSTFASSTTVPGSWPNPLRLKR